ncbi:hypothetical protein ABH922_003370 [Rhodococcus sp. 27YEA15]|uniref:hypothetical protein n=1 Tax=Rhodococcus sp. 27YEA15 TaxID=3156259 RepID=UPI003C7DF3F8
MNQLLQTVGQYWWLIFVFGGTVGGAVKGIGVANERRIERRQERFRLKQQTKVAIAQANAQYQTDVETQRRDVSKSVGRHDEVDARWFSYELDPVTLLDTPMMTDMREPLTADFHRAKHRADLLRPGNPETMLGNVQAQVEYREAVHAYVIAFEIAEAEAKRRRRSGFGLEEQERLVRAQRLLRLAMDEGATPQERQSAYRRAHKELDGLLVLPDRAVAEIERKIAGAIGA